MGWNQSRGQGRCASGRKHPPQAEGEPLVGRVREPVGPPVRQRRRCQRHVGHRRAVWCHAPRHLSPGERADPDRGEVPEEDEGRGDEDEARVTGPAQGRLPVRVAATTEVRKGDNAAGIRREDDLDEDDGDSEGEE